MTTDPKITPQAVRIAWEIYYKKDSLSLHDLVEDVRIEFEGNDLILEETGLVLSDKNTDPVFVSANELATNAWLGTYENIIKLYKWRS